MIILTIGVADVAGSVSNGGGLPEEPENGGDGASSYFLQNPIFFG